MVTTQPRRIAQTVRDVMSAEVVTASSATPFKDLVRLLEEHRISALPVLDPGRRVLGVVSEADLLLKEADRQRRLGMRSALLDPDEATRIAALRATDLMTAPAVTIGPDEAVADAARVMIRRRVKRLPVVDDSGVLLGIVSRADVLKVFLRDDDSLADDVRGALTRALGAADCAGLTVDVADGVVTVGGALADSARIPLVADTVRGVDGVVDVSFALGR
ncbi:CBS domain-containing protein [Streptacidiphilus jiangxiensis]|uniref:BON domain-containing protein n=1 Tax=Streptacidiphilus jiangxiensis TaxID=235985 RepID=A0A1H7U505_STRJI|nr:CBS domain-containing protein [Streptacidiphilus jiangxiensis]SEL91337.1 BON domain-containing protein [Streptacidiphilus jiangxiensis]